MFYNGGRAGARKPHSGHYWRVVGLVTESSQTTGILRKQQGSVVRGARTLEIPQWGLRLAGGGWLWGGCQRRVHPKRRDMVLSKPPGARRWFRGFIKAWRAKIFAKIEWKDTSKNPTGSKNNSLSR